MPKGCITVWLDYYRARRWRLRVERIADRAGDADPRLKPAALVPDDLGSVPRVVEVKVPVPSPQLRPIGPNNDPPAGKTGLAAIAAANAGATTQPTTDGFLNAIQYYDYAPGIVYTAITSPGYVTTIALRPGEKLITAAAGDTTRWMVDSVQSGSGETAQTLLLVKPRKAGLQTNLLVTTDQRAYTLAKLLGKYQSLVANGQNRALLVWQRLIYPNGNSIVLDGMPGTDEAGMAGLQDQVDYHLDKLAEATALSTAIAYAGNLSRNPQSNSGGYSSSDVIGDAVAQQANRIGEKIIDKQLDVQPTITIRQGWPLRVFVNMDMVLLSTCAEN